MRNLLPHIFIPTTTPPGPNSNNAGHVYASFLLSNTRYPVRRGAA